MGSTFKAADKLRMHQKANEEFKKGNFHTAIDLYTCILEEINPNDKDILSNRSLAYLKIGIYKLAFLDSNAALQIDPSHQKAIVRKIKSLWGLQKYEAAIQVIETKLSKAQRELPLYKDLEVKSRKFLKQSTGDYDMCELIKLSQNESHDIGEFTGPMEVVQIPGKGRGVIATADIAPGQLVMVSKAFAICLGIDNLTARMMALVDSLMCKLVHGDEDVLKEFGKLSACAGPAAPPPTWVWSNSDDPELEILKLRETTLRIKDNMFVNFKTKPISCGIWTSASYFNNDCIDANVHIQYFGDVMMIRALNQIPKGQELTIAQFPPGELELRMEFMKEGKFECNCRLCTFESQETVETKNKVQAALNSLSLVLKSHEMMRAQKAQLKKALGFFKRITELRAAHPSLNVAMFDGRIFEFSRLLFKSGCFVECLHVLETARLTLNSAPTITCGILAADALIVCCYFKLGDDNKRKSWTETFNHDLVRAFGTVEVLPYFTQCGNLQMSEDLLSQSY